VSEIQLVELTISPTLRQSVNVTTQWK